MDRNRGRKAALDSVWHHENSRCVTPMPWNSLLILVVSGDLPFLSIDCRCSVGSAGQGFGKDPDENNPKCPKPWLIL